MAYGPTVSPSRPPRHTTIAKLPRALLLDWVEAGEEADAEQEGSYHRAASGNHKSVSRGEAAAPAAVQAPLSIEEERTISGDLAETSAPGGGLHAVSSLCLLSWSIIALGCGPESSEELKRYHFILL